MNDWVNEQWGNVLLNPKTPGSTGKILLAAVHTAQQTESVKLGLQKKDTILINVPPGTTSRIQPLDVCINKPFKCYIREQFEQHLQENMILYVESKLTASDRRVLITKWVGNAWSRIKTSLKDTIVRSFLKCGISNKLDKSEDHLVSICGLEGYEMPEPEREFHLQSDDESEDDSDDEYEAGDDSSSESSSEESM